MKKLSLDDISRLNTLLDESLQQSSKAQLATCIRLLGTSLAQLKLKYQVDEDQSAKALSGFVQELEQDSFSQEFNELAAKTIVECATAMAVAKEGSSEVK